MSLIDKKIIQYKEVGKSEDEARQMALDLFDDIMHANKNCKSLSGLYRHLKIQMKREQQAQAIEQEHREAELEAHEAHE